jgi:hypothetical protein
MMHFNSEHIFNLHKTLQSIFIDSHPLFLIYLDYHNKIPQTDWLEQRELIFSPFWRLQKWRSGCQQGWCPMKALLNYRWRTIHCVLTWPFLPTQVAWFLLQRTLMPLDQGPPLMTSFNTSYFHGGPILNTATLWVKILPYEFWGDKNIQFMVSTYLLFLVLMMFVCLLVLHFCFIWDNFPCA